MTQIIKIPEQIAVKPPLKKDESSKSSIETPTFNPNLQQLYQRLEEIIN